LLQASAFTQYTGSGATGEQAQISGNLGTRFGYTFFENQNVKTHAAGTITCAAPLVKATVAKGLKDIVAYHGSALSGDVNIGDTFVIAGNTQRYVITADATAAANDVALAFEPVLAAEATADLAVTFSQNTGSQSIAFHRNIAALAMAPLSTLGSQVSGAQMATVSDPVTKLALRSSLGYDVNTKKVYVSLDVLYGMKMLRPNLGVRCWNA